MYIIKEKSPAMWGVAAVEHEMHVPSLQHAKLHILDLIERALYEGKKDITYLHEAGGNALPVLKIGLTTTTVIKLVH